MSLEREFNGPASTVLECLDGRGEFVAMRDAVCRAEPAALRQRPSRRFEPNKSKQKMILRGRLTPINRGLYCAPFQVKADFAMPSWIDGVRKCVILESLSPASVAAGHSLKN
jgi:hypothetical protein